MKKLRVLIVDDDPDFAESMAIALEGRNCQVSVEHNGEEAIQLYRHNDFDIAFFDISLPGRNGVESYMEIRRFKPSARVVMMTGYSMEELLHQATSEGAWGVLHKPLDMNAVFQMLDKLHPAGILIVDDDPEFLEIIQEIINDRGWTALTAKSGEEAIEKISAGGIDILILDLRMPIMSGLETYLELKNLGFALPTIIVTAFADAETKDIQKLDSLQVSGILRKPFDPNILLNQLANLSKTISDEIS